MGRVRRHHLTQDVQSALRAEAASLGRFIAPYREGTVYWGIIEALSQLGENETHTYGEFWSKFVEVMNDEKLKKNDGRTPFDVFFGRPKNNQTTGKDPMQKMYQNLTVLQRLGGANPYGLKLAQLNACIDILGTEENLSICLRTKIPHGESVVPLRETRQRPVAIKTIPAGYVVEDGATVDVQHASESSVLSAAKS